MALPNPYTQGGNALTSYYLRKPPKKKVAPAPRRTPPVAPAAAPQVTPEEWARQQGEQYIQSLVDAINQQKSQYLTDLNAQADLERQRGAALAQALQQLNVPGQIQGIYQGAAQDVGGLAQAFSGSLRSTAEAEAADQQRQLSGTGQEAAVAHPGEALGNVLYGTQGYIPGTSLASQGAAFASQAALEPGFAQRIGALNATDVLGQGMKGLGDFADQIIQAKGQLPDIVHSLLSDRLDQLQFTAAQSQSGITNRLNQQKQDLAILKNDQDFYYKQYLIAKSQGQEKRANQYLKLSQAREQRAQFASQGLDVNGNPKPGYHVDSDGHVVKDGWRINAAGVPVKISSAKSPKGSTSSTVPGTPAYNAKAQQAAGKARKDIDKDVAKLFRDPDPLKGENPLGGKVATVSYVEAAKQLWTKYSYLATTAQAKKTLRAQIAAALKAAGLSPAPKAPRRPKTIRGGD